MNHRKYDYTRPVVENPTKEDRIGWEIDERHIEYLHQLAVTAPPNSVLCEIGSLRGSSTSAFVEALILRPDLTLYIYETQTTPELLRLFEEAGLGVKKRLLFFHQATYDMNYGPLAKNYEEGRPTLTFIDGNHKWPALADLSLCLVRGCQVICMHDTQKHNAYAWKTCFGSILASEILRKAPNRNHWEDAEEREGERTHRGFLVSWPQTMTQTKGDWPCLALPLQ